MGRVLSAVLTWCMLFSIRSVARECSKAEIYENINQSMFCKWLAENCSNQSCESLGIQNTNNAMAEAPAASAADPAANAAQQLSPEPTSADAAAGSGADTQTQNQTEQALGQGNGSAQAQVSASAANVACSQIVNAQLSSGGYSAQVGQAKADLITLQNKCTNLKKRAESCCGTGGIACILNSGGGDKGNGEESESTISKNSAEYIGIGAQVMNSLVMMGGAGIVQNCQTLQSMTLLGGGISGAIATTCHQNRVVCSTSCNDAAQLAEALETVTSCEGNAVMATSESTQYTAKKSMLQNQAGYCTNDLSQKETALVGQTVSSLLASKVAQACKDVVAVEAQIPSVVNPKTGLACTDPAESNSPFCISQTCSLPANANLPECVQLLNKPGSTVAGVDPGSQINSGGGDDGAGFGKAIGADDAGNLNNSQAFDGLGDTQGFNSAASVAATKPGGGSAPPGGGGGGGGGSFGSTGGGAGDSKFKTDILNGTRGGGGGFSVSGTGFNSYGGGSSGSYSSYSKGRSGSSFNLKDYLPGGKKDAKRNLASVSGGQKGIGLRYENIWNKISNKYSQLCMAQRLDCGH